MVRRTRVSVTLTDKQIECIDYLIDEGLYLTRGQFISEYVRKGLREFGLPTINEADV